MTSSKYTTYRNAYGGGPSKSHGQHAQKLFKFGRVFLSYASGQTDRQANKQTYSSQYSTIQIEQMETEQKRSIDSGHLIQ